MKRPIRQKGFWRALKRGELWVVVPYDHRASGRMVLQYNTYEGPNYFAKVIEDRHCPSNTAYIMWPKEESK